MTTQLQPQNRRNAKKRIIGAISSGTAQTRAEIARVLDLSPSTVSAHVQELLDDGSVDEIGSADSQGGRRATLLRVRNQSEPVILIELGSQRSLVAIGDTMGNILDVYSTGLGLLVGPEATVEELCTVVSQTIAKHDLSDVRGVALSIPGPVDFANGTVRNPSRMPGWDHFPLRKNLEKRLELPVVIENDANLMALGEHFLSNGIDTSIYVKAGTGIGAGLVLDGELVRGANFFAGDLSHGRISDEDDVLCACGNRGCLEALASGAAIVNKLKNLGYQIDSTADLLSTVSRGDAQATALVRDAGRSVGAMLAPIIGFVNPDALFLGGALSTLDIFITAVKGQLYDRCHPLATMNLEIRQACSGENVGIIGASRLLLEELNC